MGKIIEDSEEESKKSRNKDGRLSSRMNMDNISLNSSDDGSSIDGGDDDEEKIYQ